MFAFLSNIHALFFRRSFVLIRVALLDELSADRTSMNRSFRHSVAPPLAPLAGSESLVGYFAVLLI